MKTAILAIALAGPLTAAHADPYNETYYAVLECPTFNVQLHDCTGKAYCADMARRTLDYLSAKDRKVCEVNLSRR